MAFDQMSSCCAGCKSMEQSMKMFRQFRVESEKQWLILEDVWNTILKLKYKYHLTKVDIPNKECGKSLPSLSHACVLIEEAKIKLNMVDGSKDMRLSGYKYQFINMLQEAKTCAEKLSHTETKTASKATKDMRDTIKEVKPPATIINQEMTSNNEDATNNFDKGCTSPSKNSNSPEVAEPAKIEAIEVLSSASSDSLQPLEYYMCSDNAVKTEPMQTDGNEASGARLAQSKDTDTYVLVIPKGNKKGKKVSK